MEKTTILKRKLRAVLKATIWGGALFCLFTLAYAACVHFWNSKTLFWDGFIVMAPADLLCRTFGYDLMNSGNSRMGSLIVVMVNTLLGAFIFATIAAFWQFTMKGDEE
jgi:hypothetical protein